MVSLLTPTGTWRRFTGYEIRDGYIRPGPGAIPDLYEPWELYRATRGDDENGVAPYQSLIDMLAVAAPGVTFSPSAPGRPYQVTASASTAITRWCQTYGLLGILLQQVDAVVLTPTWEPAMASGIAAPPDLLLPTLRRHVRTSRGWYSVQTASINEHRVVGDPSLLGQPVPPEKCPTLPQPGALIRDLWPPEVREEPLTDTWASFFPHVPEDERATYPYPSPSDDGFWWMYAEPVDKFIGAAAMLRDALKGLQRFEAVAMVEDPSDADVREFSLGTAMLESLIVNVNPVFKFTAGRPLEQTWVTTSLLSSLAMMAFLDVTGGNGRLLLCEACGNVFFSSAYQARYCSIRCRNRAQKRAYRQAHPTNRRGAAKEA